MKRHLDNDDIEENQIVEARIMKFEEVDCLALPMKNCEEIKAAVASGSSSLLADLDLDASTIESGDLRKILLTILDGQKRISATLDTIERNQTLISKNQSVLAERLREHDLNCVKKSEILAQQKITRDLKVSVQKVERAISSLTGISNDKTTEEIMSLLPFSSMAAINDIEEKLKSPEYAQAMAAILYKIRGGSDTVITVLPQLFSDDLLQYFNWEGKFEKAALSELTLINVILRDVFMSSGSIEFERGIRKAVARSHHRVGQKKYVQKLNNASIPLC